MSQKWFNNIDLQQNELQNGVIQNLTGDPSNGRAGQIYYNTTDKGYRYHNGTAWVSITAQAVKSIKAGDGLTSSGTDTVTINLGTPSTSGAASGTTYGSNGVTDTSHTHQVRISAATTDTPGVVELATDAEAETGTDTTRAINAKQLAKAKQSAINSAKVTIQTSNGITGGSTTPGNSFALSGVDALTTAKGVVQLATQDEVNTGTDAKKVITPATLRKGKASGVASLDANSKIITSQLPDYLLGQVMYGGNALVAATTIVTPSASLKTKKNITTASISIVNSATSTAANTYGYKDMEGVYFICQAKGTFAETSFETGDWIISTGSAWEKIDNTDAVKSVNGQIGDVNITRVDEAGTADKLKTARTIALKGDATGSTTFDGSANKDINVTLANTGVTAGTYNNVTVDAKGRVVSASNIKTSVVSEITGNGKQTEFNITHSLGKNVIVQVFLNGQQIGSDTADELVGVDIYTTAEKVKLVFATAPSTSQKFKVVISSGGNGVESLTPTAADDNKVAIADSTSATGWKFGKVGTDNLDKTSILNLVYPVGSIYMSANNVSPQTFLGGTWVAWGAGRVPVGVSSSDTDFNTAEKTGGEKTHGLSVDEMPRHDHSGTNSTVEMQTIHTRPTGGRLEHLGIRTYTVKYDVNEQTQEYMVAPAGGQTLDVENGTVINSQYGVCPNGLGVAHNNLQPYITCYMWKRTA